MKRLIPSLLFSSIPLIAQAQSDVTTTWSAKPGASSKQTSKTNLGDISPNGSLVYSIPIELPPGRGGVAPQLALSYSSEGGNTSVGKGWLLAGLPAIVRTRAGATVDDWRGTPSYSELGWEAPVAPQNELVSNGGQFVPLPHYWRTKVDRLTRFSKHGTCGSENCYWTAIDHNGFKYYYGGTASSNASSSGRNHPGIVWSLDGLAISAWGLVRVEGPSGNYWTVEYHDEPEGQHTLLPKTIEYTMHANLPFSSTREVNFIYYDRTDSTRAPARHLKRLAAIDTGGTKLKLRYEPGQLSDRSLLTKLEFEDLTTFEDVRSVTLSYTSGLDSNRTALLEHDLDLVTLDGESPVLDWTSTEVVDLNGDGLDDIVRHDIGNGPNHPNGIQKKMYLSVQFSQGDSVTHRNVIVDETGDTTHSLSYRWQPQFTDMSGDGIADLFISRLGLVDESGTIQTRLQTRLYKSQPGSALLGQPPGNWGGPSTSFVETSIYLWPEFGNPAQMSFGDFNGDRITDIIIVSPFYREYKIIYGDGLGNFVNLTTGSLPTNVGPEPCVYYNSNHVAPRYETYPWVAECVVPLPQLFVIRDFNRDGRDDLVWLEAAPYVVDYPGPNYLRVQLSITNIAGDLDFYPAQTVVTDNLAEGFWSPTVGDFDGNGFPDISLGVTWDILPSDHRNTGREMYYMLNPGVEPTSPLLLAMSNPIPYPFQNSAILALHHAWDSSADLDGDGRDEVLATYTGHEGLHFYSTTLEPQGFSWFAAFSQDTNPWSDGTHPGFFARRAIADFDGDGDTDVGSARVGLDSNGDGNLRFYLMANKSSTLGVTSEISFETSSASPIKPGAYRNAAFLGDINGDQRADIVFAPHEIDPASGNAENGVTALISQPQPTEKLKQVVHSSGLTISIDYERSLMIPGVVSQVQDSNPAEQDPLLKRGQPARSAGFVVSRILRETHGRTLSDVTAEFSDRRWHPRSDIIDADQTTAFSSVWLTEQTTGVTSIRSYAQTPLSPAQLVGRISMDADELISHHWSQALEYVDNGYNGTFVRKTSETDDYYERGVQDRRVETTFNYDYVGLPDFLESKTYDLTSGQLVESQHTIRSHEYDAPTWNIGRIRSQRTCKAGALLDWSKHYYVGSSREVVEVQRLLHENGNDQICPDPSISPDVEYDAEISAGRARWVPVVQQAQYQAGLVTSSQNSLGFTTSIGYDPAYMSWIASEIDPLLHETKSSYSSEGRLTGKRDANGHWTTSVVDPSGRVHTGRLPVVPGAADSLSITYTTANGPVQKITSLTKFSTIDHSTEVVHFDGVGNEIDKELSYHDGRIIRTHESSGSWTDSSFPGAGRFESHTEPYFCASSNSGCDPAVEKIVYSDDLGRPVLENWVDTNGIGHVAKEFNYAFRTRQRTDGLGQSHIDKYDATGQLVEILDPAGGSTTFSYYPSGRLKTIKRPDGQTITWSYDSWGRVTLLSDPETAKTEYGWNDDSTVDWEQNELGQLIDYAYDAVGRTTSVASSLGDSYTFVYDDPNTVNGIGRLSWVEHNGQMTRRVLAYDAMGRETIVENYGAAFPQGLQHQFAYDWRGRLTSKTFPNGDTQINTYLPGGGPLKTVSFNGSDIWNATAHDASGRPTTIQSDSGTDFNRTYRYDGLPTSSWAYSNVTGEFLQYSIYTWDATGNLQFITDQRPDISVGGVDTDLSQSFTYDPLQRLKTATGLYGSHIYDYTAAGDLTIHGPISFTSRTGPPAHGASLFIDASDNQGLVSTVGYDRAGRSTHLADSLTGTTQVFQRDGFGRTTSIDVAGAVRVEASYNLDGDRRYKRSWHAGGGWTDTYYLEGDYEVRAWSGSSDIQHTAKIFAEKELAAAVTDVETATGPLEGDVLGWTDPYLPDTEQGPAPGFWYYLSDQVGSTTVLTDVNGQIVNFFVRTPFGEVLDQNSVGLNTSVIGFGAMPLDSESGLSVFPGRQYSARFGRFLAADAVQPFDGLNPQLLNRFSYVLNNPTRYIDPTGNRPEELMDGHNRSEVTSKFEDWSRSKPLLVDFLRWDHEDIEILSVALADTLAPGPADLIAGGLLLGRRIRRLSKLASDAADAARTVERATGGPPGGGPSGKGRTLFHYTDDKGLAGITESKKLNPSLRANNPKDVRYGEGQYLSDIRPGTKTPAELSRKFLNIPFQGKKFKNFVEINVDGLPLVEGRDGVFVVPGNTPLDISDRLVSSGAN